MGPGQDPPALGGGEFVRMPGEPWAGHDQLRGVGLDRAPAGLGPRRGADVSTECPGERLAPEADAEHRYVGAVGRAQQLELAVDPVVRVRVDGGV